MFSPTSLDRLFHHGIRNPYEWDHLRCTFSKRTTPMANGPPELYEEPFDEELGPFSPLNMVFMDEPDFEVEDIEAARAAPPAAPSTPSAVVPQLNDLPSPPEFVPAHEEAAASNNCRVTPPASPAPDNLGPPGGPQPQPAPPSPPFPPQPAPVQSPQQMPHEWGENPEPPAEAREPRHDEPGEDGARARPRQPAPRRDRPAPEPPEDGPWMVALEVNDGDNWGNEPVVPPPAPPGLPPGSKVINNSVNQSHSCTIPRHIPILVPAGPTWVGTMAYIVTSLLLPLLLFRSLSLLCLLTCLVVSLGLKPLMRAISLWWRWSKLRKKLKFDRNRALVVRAMGPGAAERAIRNIRLGPVDERRIPFRMQLLAWFDASVQRAATAFGVTSFVQTGVLTNKGVYECPVTTVDLRPSEYRGTASSKDVCEVMIAEIEDIHAQSKSLILYNQSMVNNIGRTLATMPASQRYSEAGPRANRITDLQIPETIYRAVQAGSARVALMEAAANDIADRQALGTLQDFHKGSPSTPFTASDIVLLTGAPCLLFLAMTLVSLCTHLLA